MRKGLVCGAEGVNMGSLKWKEREMTCVEGVNMDGLGLITSCVRVCCHDYWQSVFK